MPAEYRVYVLKNPAGKFYIGFTENVALRIQQHNSGLTRSTRSKGPWKLAWQSDALTQSDARSLELDLKRQKGGNGFYQKTGLKKS
jgi:putative endonuclease